MKEQKDDVWNRADIEVRQHPVQVKWVIIKHPKGNQGSYGLIYWKGKNDQATS